MARYSINSEIIVRKLYWYLSSYIKKHGLIVVITVVLASILFSFFVPVLVTIIENKQQHYIGIVGEYNLSNLPLEITQLMSSGVTRIEEDGSAVPDIAERWTTEDDGRTFRFVLKKNLKWQDGKTLIPSDIKYQFADVETITTPNDILFKLPEVFMPFPGVVARPILRSGQERYLFFFRRPTLIGLGHYRLQSYQQKGNRLTSVTLENPQERRKYRFYLTEADAILAYKRGEIDVLNDLTSQPDVSQWPTTQTDIQLDPDRYLAVFFNFESPLFPKNVRQALSYATSKPSGETRAVGPISPKSWAYLPSAKAYDFDVNRGVERLITEIDQLANQPLNIELTTIPTFEADANQMKQEWEELGKRAYEACQAEKAITDKATCERVNISVSLRITSFPDTQNFQVMLIGQESPADPDQYGLWHSNQQTNFTHYRNTRIDSLLEKGRQTLDRTERLAIYQEFQQFLLEDAPAIFIRHLDSYDIKRK